MSRAQQLKEEGNRHFQSGDYAAADSLYSKAIIADASNPALYTNRAMARLKLGYWDSVISDCQACLALTPSNMKANYQLAQAQLGIQDFDAALDSARRAHALCAASNDKSLASVTEIVLRCKKERWEHAERRRAREDRDLEREALEAMARQCEADLCAVEGGDEAERREVEEEGRLKLARLRDVFERSRSQAEKRRQVPDWAIDDISFGIMVDPVITKTGKSYERASIMEHLRRHATDPLTREPLYPQDLRPNKELRQACEEFLDQNGWAVDW